MTGPPGSSQRRTPDPVAAGRQRPPRARLAEPSAPRGGAELVPAGFAQGMGDLRHHGARLPAALLQSRLHPLRGRAPGCARAPQEARRAPGTRVLGGAAFRVPTFRPVDRGPSTGERCIPGAGRREAERTDRDVRRSPSSPCRVATDRHRAHGIGESRGQAPRSRTSFASSRSASFLYVSSLIFPAASCSVRPSICFSMSAAVSAAAV